MIETQLFGRTGHRSRRVIFGAAALSSATPAEADQALEVLLQHEVNHLDVAADYGAAERRVGPWLRRHRERFFVATKTGKRTRGPALAELRRSLRRLQVERIDLIQLHNLVDPAEWELVFSAGGALEALIEARAQGLVSHIGVTGHGTTAPDMHRQSLERFAFDSVLLPYNYVMMQDRRYAADVAELLRTCRERNVAVQTIKSVACRPWPAGPRLNTWYEPLAERADVARAVSWVLSEPQVFLITPGDLSILSTVLAAAAQPISRPEDSQMAAMASRLSMEPIFRGSDVLMARQG